MSTITAWWEKLPESTRRAIKTLWQAFLSTFLVTFFGGLTGGLISINALGALAVSALSAAIAAVAAKIVNLCHDRAEEGVPHE